MCFLVFYTFTYIRNILPVPQNEKTKKKLLMTNGENFNN